jgi:hypothetical protein
VNNPANIAAFILPLSFFSDICIAHASADTSRNAIPIEANKIASVNSIKVVFGSIPESKKKPMEPSIPPIIMNFFLPKRIK